ncbi:bifunctional hydroxymethylpyrimidine kinase/phosphomethylpyrimidine kinase [Acetobacteraceae bacterium ESL0709]|nr:bifunctional hydroxymethylpyrimidine kinase/phosphomethylpyrimidine kinase [Acetobacteraceae bacterium ESL0697]MDF7678174.1 bifunctional hydroxymethylpyrimidine kinase/phosphomethylpyrimidine kinase [Acetobacteraceae bacterium ESL0709]
MNKAESRAAIPTVLTIAGTDPTGGAGILADVKTVSALGGYALAVPTAIIAQNSRYVSDIWPLSFSMIMAQLECVEEDIPPSVIKIGMLPNSEVVSALASFLARQKKLPPIVMDPVLKASAGQSLVQSDLIPALKEKLFPYLRVLTPNLAESAALLDSAVARDRDEMRVHAASLGKLGAFWVLLKGGHLESEIVSPDLLRGPEGQEYWFESPRIKTEHGRGTGCTLSAALAFYLCSCNIYEAVERAKSYLYGSLLKADQLGLVASRGPLNHFG